MTAWRSWESVASERTEIRGMWTREVWTNSSQAASERARFPSMMQAQTWSWSCGLRSQRRRDMVNGETTGYTSLNSGSAETSERTWLRLLRI